MPNVALLPITQNPDNLVSYIEENFRRIAAAFAIAETTGFVLPGQIVASANIGSVPLGWLLCNGQSVTKAAYPNLFNAIGYQYGGSGANFNVPNYVGRVLVGRDAGQTEFDVLGETGGAKTVSADLAGHSHTFSTDTRNTNHAHNVYARNQDTGWCNQNWAHWHPAHIGNMHWNGTQTHGHHDRGSVASEAPWEGANWAGTVPVNVDTRDTNHTHNFNHDHPSTNYASESPWPGDYNHFHAGTTANAGAGGGHNNLQPYIVVNYLIKI